MENTHIHTDPKSNHLLSPWTRPPPPPTPFPSGNHHSVACVHEFQFDIPHISEVIWFLAFLTELFHLASYSGGPSRLSQMTVFRLFYWLSCMPLYICNTSSVSSLLSKDTLVVILTFHFVYVVYHVN